LSISEFIQWFIINQWIYEVFGLGEGQVTEAEPLYVNNVLEIALPETEPVSCDYFEIS